MIHLFGALVLIMFGAAAVIIGGAWIVAGIYQHFAGSGEDLYDFPDDL